MRYFIFTFVLLLWFNASFAQDSLTLFKYEEYISLVKEHHPIAFQSSIALQKGEANLLKSKGGFDPKLAGNIRQKYFEGKKYYSHLDAGLKVPTWFGITVQGGYGDNEGVFLNPEARVPNDGLWYAGVTLNLGNGLFMDKRRADLKQAKIYINSTDIERKLMLNQLLYDASIAYWDWFKAVEKVNVYERGKETASFRLRSVIQSAELGDKAFVDTLKAKIQLQNRLLDLEQAKLDVLNKKAYLESFLWLEGYVPLVLEDHLMPDASNLFHMTSRLSFTNRIDSLVENHPEMAYYKNGIDIAKIQYRLKKEGLKPTVQLKYNLLSTPINSNVMGDFTLDNYYWSAGVSYPIFTRKDRGDLKLASLKIQEKQSQTVNLNAKLNYKLSAAYNSIESFEVQVQQFENALENYEMLFNAEYALFNVGESSLFLVNFREQEWIKAQVKMIDIYYQLNIFKENFKRQTVTY